MFIMFFLTYVQQNLFFINDDIKFINNFIVYCGYFINTITLPCLNYFRDIFYEENLKIVPVNIYFPATKWRMGNTKPFGGSLSFELWMMVLFTSDINI